MRERLYDMSWTAYTRACNQDHFLTNEPLEAWNREAFKQPDHCLSTSASIHASLRVPTANYNNHGSGFRVNVNRCSGAFLFLFTCFQTLFHSVELFCGFKMAITVFALSYLITCTHVYFCTFILCFSFFFREAGADNSPELALEKLAVEPAIQMVTLRHKQKQASRKSETWTRLFEVPHKPNNNWCEKGAVVESN